MDKKKYSRLRLAVQGAAALLQNANFKGFFTGKISEGAGKNVCVPGLNCYSCPGAVGACPLGSLQNALSAYRFRFPYYVLGLLLFFGALCGRLICGFLCPFGLLQDLLHKIPFPKKLKTFKGDRVLRYLKYLVLIIMVLILPYIFKLTPVFCKYLCPSGTLSGILLILANPVLKQALGFRFLWKCSILLAVILLAIMIYRPFCKYLCPLGAIYGPFNHISLLQMKVEEDKCIHCNTCAEVCGMGVDPVKNINSSECIRCGHCAAACPRQAIHYTGILDMARRKQAKTTEPAKIDEH